MMEHSSLGILGQGHSFKSVLQKVQVWQSLLENRMFIYMTTKNYCSSIILIIALYGLFKLLLILRSFLNMITPFTRDGKKQMIPRE